MSRLTSESEVLPDRERFGPHKARWSLTINPGDLMKRFFMGLLGSCFVSSIVFFLQIKAFIAFILAAILTFLGWTTQPPQAVKDAGKQVAKDFEAKFKDHVPPVRGGIPSGGHTIPVTLPGIGQKTPEQLKLEAELKEAERKRKEESERKDLLARADVIGLHCDADWPLEKLRIQVRTEEHRIEEEARKKPLLARADAIGLQVDPTADAKTLKHQVEAAEAEIAADKEYQAKLRQYDRDVEAWKHRVEKGPNARCPGNRCGYAMRFNKSRIGTQFYCPRCGGIFPVGAAMARWTPPPPPKEPAQPKKNPGLWKRIFG